jgi:hypothetical protein
MFCLLGNGRSIPEMTLYCFWIAPIHLQPQRGLLIRYPSVNTFTGIKKGKAERLKK